MSGLIHIENGKKNVILFYKAGHRLDGVKMKVVEIEKYQLN